MSEHFQLKYLHPRHAGTWLLFGFVWIASLLPRSFALATGRWIGGVFYRRNAKRREIARINIGMCFPDLDENQREAMVREHFSLYGCNVIDFGLSWWGSRRRLRKLVHLKGVEKIHGFHKQNRRVILIAPHTVGMDVGGIVLASQFSMTSMMKRAPDPLLNWMLTRRRSRFGGRMFMRDESLRPMIRAIRDGYLCYFIPDEDFGLEHSIFAPFFGVPSATLTVVGRMARLTNAVVIPVVTWLNPENGIYTIDIGDPMEGFPSGDEQRDAVMLNEALEQRVRLAPSQYMWTLRWFKTRPGGAPSPYEHLVSKRQVS